MLKKISETSPSLMLMVHTTFMVPIVAFMALQLYGFRAEITSLVEENKALKQQFSNYKFQSEREIDKLDQAVDYLTRRLIEKHTTFPIIIYPFDKYRLTEFGYPDPKPPKELIPNKGILNKKKRLWL